MSTAKSPYPGAFGARVPRRRSSLLPLVRGIGDWLRWEGVAVTLLLIAALFVRAHLLTELPAGIHGDEAIFGTEGDAVLHGAAVGPYSFIAAGQPTGPFYLDAIAVALFGRTIFAVRVVSMLAGALTIAALYVVVRRAFARTPAMIAAMLLATMNWHLHFSRVGFALALWLFGVVLITGALMEAIRRRDARWWGATGALAGLALYTYNAHTVFLAILGLFVAGFLLRAVVMRTLAPRECVRALAAFAGALALTAAPMAAFVLREQEHYRAHLGFWSIFKRPEWQSLPTPAARLAFLAARYLSYWDQITFHPRFDGADATGIIPSLPPALLVLALSGLVLALVRYRTPLVWFGLAVILLMPLATVFTVDGISRRTFASAAFVALFAAFPFVEAVRLAWAWGTAPGRVLGIGVAACLFLLVAGQALSAYFGAFAASPLQAFVFTEEITDASRFMATLPADDYVYFASDRWSLKYETRQFLAPAVRGEDRSAEFGQPGTTIDPARGRPVFVFLGRYFPQYEAVQARYPGGTLLVGGPVDRPTFVAYLPPVPG